MKVFFSRHPRGILKVASGGDGHGAKIFDKIEFEYKELLFNYFLVGKSFWSYRMNS